MKNNAFILFIVLLSMFHRLYAQTAKPDSSFYTNAVRNTIHFYRQQTGTQSHLYNGRLYYPAINDIKGHPYLITDTVLSGSIVFDNVLYEDVLFQYDLLNDHIIVAYPGQGIRLSVNKSKISSFTLLNRTFVNSTQDNDSNRQNADVGFYEVLYSGKTKVLAKRKKLISSIVTQDGRSSTYKEQNRYFIMKENNLYEVKKVRSLYKIFPGKKEQLRSLFHSFNNNSNSSFETILVNIFEAFDKQ